MRKLALSDRILMSVDKPARYIGNEWNSVMKEKSDVKIRFALCFPDVYEIGMSHLGIQILYNMYNQRPDIWCERVYSPWTDLDQIMRERNIPLFAVESQDPVKEFDFLGITIQYEMCYTNILQILDLSQIPLHACDRAEDDPIVIGGGPCTYNPEPLADFFDLFYIGEGEVANLALTDLYLECKEQNTGRQEFLRRAAKLPGIYVPSLYRVSYHEDGTISAFTPLCGEAPEQVRKVIETELDDAYYPDNPVVPFIKVTQDRLVLEIQRGCIRGCRFCQAGMVYRPVRERSLSWLKEKASKMLKSTGHEEISLSSLSSSDFSQLEELIRFLIEEIGEKKINISLPSLRIDAFSLDVMRRIQDVKKSSLTFAPEAGTQRLRDVINKGLTQEDILTGAAAAFEGGWNKVKLYFMLGLPSETEEDMEGIAALSNEVARVYYDTVPKEKRNGRVQVTASSSFFIPKPFTPFQWASMLEAEEYLERARVVNHAMKEQLNRKSLNYQWHSPETTIIEGVLARGDRRVGAVIEAAYRNGCIYDAWTESFHYDKWMEAFAAVGLDYHFYTSRTRNLDEIFPWDFIDTGVTREFLKREWKRAQEGRVTPNCRAGCAGCGAKTFGGGVCYETEN